MGIREETFSYTTVNKTVQCCQQSLITPKEHLKSEREREKRERERKIMDYKCM